MMHSSNTPETTALYECANCGAVWTAAQLAPYHDFWSRVHPGEIIPQGDCPDCGAFCYPAEPLTTPLHLWTITHEHKHGTDMDVFASKPEALQQLGRLQLDWLGDHVDAFDAAELPDAQAILTYLDSIGICIFCV